MDSVWPCSSGIGMGGTAAVSIVPNHVYILCSIQMDGIVMPTANRRRCKIPLFRVQQQDKMRVVNKLAGRSRLWVVVQRPLDLGVHKWCGQGRWSLMGKRRGRVRLTNDWRGGGGEEAHLCAGQPPRGAEG